MRGTLTTTKFASRADFEAGRPGEIIVCRNAFVNVGLAWMWSMMTGQLRDEDGQVTDHLGSARLAVGNSEAEVRPDQERLAGEETAQAGLDEGYPVIAGPVETPAGTGYRATFRATFGELEAAFDWRERAVLSAQGVMIDRAVGDQGRKPLGSIWQVEAALDLLHG